VRSSRERQNFHRTAQTSPATRRHATHHAAIKIRRSQPHVTTLPCPCPEYLAGKRGFDYILTVKGNQPTLQDSVIKAILPVLGTDPDHVVTERGHGRINQWKTWTTDTTGIVFPHVQQVACIRRDGFTLDGTWISKEHALIITSSKSATSAEMHTHVRQHWGIENKSHYVRDTTWREDAQQVYTGSGPQVMATLRNMAAGLLRLNDFTKIKETTEWIGRDRKRALPLLATHSDKRYLK
jgi:predicted transposase YbfD/YdcC